MKIRPGTEAWKVAYLQKKLNSWSLRKEKESILKEWQDLVNMFSPAETASTGSDLKSLRLRGSNTGSRTTHWCESSLPMCRILCLPRTLDTLLGQLRHIGPHSARNAWQSNVVDTGKRNQAVTQRYRYWLGMQLSGTGLTWCTRRPRLSSQQHTEHRWRHA